MRVCSFSSSSSSFLDTCLIPYRNDAGKNSSMIGKDSRSLVAAGGRTDCRVPSPSGVAPYYHMLRRSWVSLRDRRTSLRSTEKTRGSMFVTMTV